MEYILQTHAISKKYGAQYAVDKVDMHVRQGAVYGLIGRNGAGKTTLLKMIAGLAKPTSGDYSIFEKRGEAREALIPRIGTLIESPGIFPYMTAEENLRVKAKAIGLREKGAEKRALETVGLTDTGKKKVKAFSMGMKQRLGVALALLGEPDIMLLDEPINGLDPQGIVEMREIIARLNGEYHITIIISSHILEELSKVATHYGIIHNGRMLEELSREELLEKGGEHIELKTNDPAAACTVLEGMGINRYKVLDQDTIRVFERLNESAAIAMELGKAQVQTFGFSLKNEGLEEYYLNMTGGGVYA